MTAASHQDEHPEAYLVAALSPDIFLKSRRTRRVMNGMVLDNLVAALGPGASVGHHPGHRLRF